MLYNYRNINIAFGVGVSMSIRAKQNDPRNFKLFGYQFRITLYFVDNCLIDPLLEIVLFGITGVCILFPACHIITTQKYELAGNKQSFSQRNFFQTALVMLELFIYLVCHSIYKMITIKKPI